ncbi:Hemerythrin HHE cation binding domain protein [Methanocella conradii HZ254]|uniref:Hemerythrin HHE cation binding domain protein n=1 Tax=Methanocella conradii (strain DSM 24694 / JCM 17849 / CGMCC 1.5162 / HZ254) TaxID=1041930 RepID=H8I859_METCZ|nr:hemerythrin domain-containing protein [Methanocella conradii]AFD00877.1 Hemerythrin HHE cation binding domain protein [Methanocella conradii HZ254]
MDYRIPGVLKTEHEELYTGLNRAARVGGDVGDAAVLAFKSFQPHAKKEEELAFPPLDLLPSLAEKGVTTEVAGMIKVCDRLKRELHALLREHDAMRKALEEMNEAAMREQKPDYAALAKKLMHHIMLEEHVLYPAAILVGEHIKLALYGPPATIE